MKMTPGPQEERQALKPIRHSGQTVVLKLQRLSRDALWPKKTFTWERGVSKSVVKFY